MSAAIMEYEKAADPLAASVYIDMYEWELTPSEIDFKHGWKPGTAAKLAVKVWAADKPDDSEPDPDRLPSVTTLSKAQRAEILHRWQDGELARELADEYAVDFVSVKNLLSHRDRNGDERSRGRIMRDDGRGPSIKTLSDEQRAECAAQWRSFGGDKTVGELAEMYGIAYDSMHSFLQYERKHHRKNV